MAGGARPFWRTLYFQVLVAIALGILVGWLFPEFGRGLRPLVAPALDLESVPLRLGELAALAAERRIKPVEAERTLPARDDDPPPHCRKPSNPPFRRFPSPRSGR